MVLAVFSEFVPGVVNWFRAEKLPIRDRPAWVVVACAVSRSFTIFFMSVGVYWVNYGLYNDRYVKDYQMVLQLWDTQHCSEQAATIKLTQIVDAMKSCKKDSVFIVAQVKAFLQAHPSKQDMSIINELLKSLGSQLDSHLVDVIRNRF